MSKRNIIIVSILLILIICGLLFWYLSEPESEQGDNVSQEIPSTSLPTSQTSSSSGDEGISEAYQNLPILSQQEVFPQKISDSKAFDFWVNTQTFEVYYLTLNGGVYAAKEGEDIEISSQEIQSPNALFASPSGTKALVSFGNPNSPRWGIFDVMDKVWKPLSQEIILATWGETEDELYTQTRNRGKISLNKLDISGNSFKSEILESDFFIHDSFLFFLPPESLIIAEKSSPQKTGSFWILNTKTNRVTRFAKPSQGLWIEPSTDRSYLFRYFNDSEGKPVFSILDKGFSSEKSGFFFTFPDKCTNLEDSIFCFTPGSASQKIPSVSEYLTHKSFTIDELFEYSFKTEKLGIPLSFPLQEFYTIDAFHPTVSENMIYFINRYDKGIYAMPLFVSKGEDPENELGDSE